jgi:GTPase SAR1 family protein
MTRNFFREAAVGLVVYDVTSQASFASVPQWLADFADACPDALTVLVANKADVPDEARRVATADGAAFAAARGLPFSEVSAKTGARVEEMFAHVAQALVTARRSRLAL